MERDNIAIQVRSQAVQLAYSLSQGQKPVEELVADAALIADFVLQGLTPDVTVH
jgi:hypothetical protein